MKLYSKEVNQYNYKEYSLEELMAFSSMLKSRIREIEEKKEYSLFENEELFEKKCLNRLLQREIKVRAKDGRNQKRVRSKQ